MVCDTILYHPTLLQLIRLLDTTAGREKILRVLQYLARFLGHYYITRGTPQLGALFKGLQAQFTMVRKVLRFLKPLNHLEDAAKAYDNKVSLDSVLRLVTVGKNLAYAGYLAFDTVALGKILNLVSSKTFTKAPKYANYCWFFGLLFGLAMDLRKISLSTQKIAALSAEEEKSEKLIAQARKDKYGATRRLVWDSLDFFMVLNNLQYLKSDEHYVALAGSITSLLGAQDLWRAARV